MSQRLFNHESKGRWNFTSLQVIGDIYEIYGIPKVLLCRKKGQGSTDRRQRGLGEALAGPCTRVERYFLWPQVDSVAAETMASFSAAVIGSSSTKLSALLATHDTYWP